MEGVAASAYIVSPSGVGSLFMANVITSYMALLISIVSPASSLYTGEKKNPLHGARQKKRA